MAEEYDSGGAAATSDGSLTVPEDGDPLTAASVRASIEELGDAVERLTQLVLPGEGYPGTADYNRQIGFGSVLSLDANGTFDTFGATGAGVGNVSNTPSTSGDAFVLVSDVTAHLPHGCSWTAVSVLVAGGTTSAGVPSGMPRLRVYSQDQTAGGGSPPYTEHESTTDPAATQVAWQAKHQFQCSIDPPITVDREANGRRYYVELRGDYGATVTQSARFLGFALAFAADTLDPAAG